MTRFHGSYGDSNDQDPSQEITLGAFRTRAGIVLSAAAIVTSFLGGQALGTNGFDNLSWVAIGAFAVVGLATVCVLWPDDDWQFEAIPNQVIGTYIEREDGVDVPLFAIHRDPRCTWRTATAPTNGATYVRCDGPSASL